MPHRPVHVLLVLVSMIAVTATLASAQDAGLAAPHVRGANIDAALLFDELIARSPTARDLVDRLERSDLVVYVRYEWFASTTLRGRIGLLAADTNRRRLLIQIDPRHNRTDQLVALGHELRHAVEIADAPSVWDVRSMAALYTAIGELTGDADGLATYETAAADATGRRVRSDLATVTISADTAGARN